MRREVARLQGSILVWLPLRFPRHPIPGGIILFDAASSQGKILSIGHNLARLRLRNAAIQNAGYQVITTWETAVVLDLARSQDFDAIIICSSIPSHLREDIARELKRLRTIPPLIVICEEREQECFQGLAEEVVCVPHTGSQQPVVDAIRRVVGRQEEKKGKAL